MALDLPLGKLACEYTPPPRLVPVHLPWPGPPEFNHFSFILASNRSIKMPDPSELNHFINMLGMRLFTGNHVASALTYV